MGGSQSNPHPFQPGTLRSLVQSRYSHLVIHRVQYRHHSQGCWKGPVHWERGLEGKEERQFQRRPSLGYWAGIVCRNCSSEGLHLPSPSGPVYPAFPSKKRKSLLLIEHLRTLYQWFPVLWCVCCVCVVCVCVFNKRDGGGELALGLPK